MKKIIILTFIISCVLSGGGVYLLCKYKMKSPDERNVFEYLPVYGYGDGEEISEDFWVRIPVDIGLIEKLRILAEKLEDYRFGLPLEILSLKEFEGKTIAIVNLKEGDWNREVSEEKEGYKGDSWRYGYFQGSAGGKLTSITLKETFLQKDYGGEWIDGVKFYYEGYPVSEDEWVHLKIFGIIYRE